MRRLRLPLLAVASGLLTALALPLAVPYGSLREVDPAGHLELLAWVGLVPALVALIGARRTRGAAALGLLAGFTYFWVAIWWVSHAMTAFGGLPAVAALPALALLVLYMAGHWALLFAVAHRIRARLGWPLHLHLPPAWAAAELLRNYLFSGFPWADLGYTQVRTLPVAQLAAVTGVYGVAALVAAVNAALAEAWVARRAGGGWRWRPVAAVGALVALVVAGGTWHLRGVRAAMAAAPSVRVGVVQPNVDQSTKNAARENAAYILGRLVPPTLEADRRGADLVAWPEAAYPLYVPPGITSFDDPEAGLPRLARAHLLMGVATLERLRGDGGELHYRVGNEQFLLTPELERLGSYRKHHLVPFGEYVPSIVKTLLPFVDKVVPSVAAVAPGSELRVLAFTPRPGAATPAALAPAEPVRLAPLICFDAIFPEVARAFAAQQPAPDLLVNATNDAWYGYSSGPYQFLAIVRMRAIETGRAVIRPAYAGVSAVILPTGELAPGWLEVGPVDPDLAPRLDEPPGLLVTDVPRLQGRTLYTRLGDLFAWACVAATLAALGLALRRRRPAA
ncbi:MAG: apolipoprotein N-acyltransferase [Anaeromyxobacter sp.]